eukprot:TRINITY_DN109735_c0_g1_i1.p1 TRINITY_DN109735_c0_g1~~TRINITY_DN109735_c0_g1_i1.p1  ORF type:complete len:348 (-),score=38.34 TRINITY_DN109735_c0_g1_i1:76-1017(-)
MARATRVVLAKVVPTTHSANAAHPPMPFFLGQAAVQATGAVGSGIMLASRLLMWGAEAKVHGVGKGSVLIVFELELPIIEHAQLQSPNYLMEVAQVIHGRVSRAIGDAALSESSLKVHHDGSTLKVFVDGNLHADIEILRCVPADGSAVGTAESLLKDNTDEWALTTSPQMARLLNAVMTSGGPFISSPRCRTPLSSPRASSDRSDIQTAPSAAGGSTQQGIPPVNEPGTPNTSVRTASPHSRTGRNEVRKQVRRKMSQLGETVRCEVMESLQLDFQDSANFTKSDWIAISMALEQREAMSPGPSSRDAARQR